MLGMVTSLFNEDLTQTVWLYRGKWVKRGMVDKETNRQTKVHFKMYKDGKQWVTRGLALFAVSLMVGGPVANTLTNVKNNVAFAQTTDSSSSDSVALTSTNNVVSANQKLNADYAAWQKQEVELQKDATFNQFMFMDDVVRNAVLDGHNAAGRGDYAGVVSADAQLLHYVSIVQEALRLLKTVDPATKGYNDLFEDLHLANQHDPKAVEAHVIALGGVVNDLTNANDFDDTKAPDMAGDKTPAQSNDLTDLENRIQNYYQNHGRFGIPAAVIKDVYNEIVAEETTPSKSADADEVKVLQDLFTKMKQADLAYVDSTVHAVVAQAVDDNNQATHDGVPASVKEPAYQALVAEAANQTHPDSLGLELQTLGNLLQKMIDEINAYKPIDLPAGSTAANQTAVVSDANSFFASNLMDQGRSSYGSMAQSLATSAAKDSALSQINVDAGANSGKVSDSDLAADVTNATSGIDSAANVSDVNSIVNSYESNLVSQSVATSNSIATSIANSVAASESASISASTSASIANSLVQSQIASQAESSAAQSMIESGRSADASQEASLASSASAKSMIESGRSADASQESTLASSAANSAAQSMIEAGRSAAMSQEASLAASASAQSLINAGRDSLIAQESQLASEAAHEKSVADFNKAKSDAVASTKAEAKSKGVANDKDVVKAIEQISKATDQKSLQNAVDQAAIAIANAVDRAKNAKSGHRDGHTTSGNNNTKGGATKNQNPEQGQQGIVNGGSNGQANPGQGHNGTKGDKNGHQKSEQGQGIVAGGSNGGSSNGGVNGNQVAGQNGGYTDGSNVAGVTNGQVAGNNAGDVVLPSLNGVSTTNVSTPTQSTTGNATAGAVTPLVNATTGTNTTGAATAGTTTGSVPAQATGATSGTTTTHNDKPTKTKTAAKTDTGTATVQGATGSAADPATRALRDSQMKHNDNSALLTSLLSLLIAAAAGFWFFLWKRRKDQEEKMDANFAGDDEALSNEVKNIKDSWK